MKKRILPVILMLILFITPLFSACGRDNPATETVALSGYTIIYPENSAGLEASAAEFLADYVKKTTGLELTVSSDKAAAETAKEILIGETDRAASATAATRSYDEDDILIQKSDEKIILYGEALMVAGAVGQFCSKHIAAAGKAIDLSLNSARVNYATAATKNMLYLIGDGMAENQVRLTESAVDGFEFFGRLLPYQGKHKTDCFNASLTGDTTTDSAAAGTALACGTKTKYGSVGVDKDGNEVQNIREAAHAAGYKTGVVTSDAPWGATPSAFTAHIDSRYKVGEIYEQQQVLIESGAIDYFKGSIHGIKAGAGNASYKPGEHDITEPGVPGGGDMYEFVKEGLWTVRGDQFLMMIEEDDIDNWAHRVANKAFPDDKADKVVAAVERFNKYVGYALSFALAHPGTAVIITGDHETGDIRYSEETGEFSFNSVNHSSADVPFYAFGTGMDCFEGKEIAIWEVAGMLAETMGLAF